MSGVASSYRSPRRGRALALAGLHALAGCIDVEAEPDAVNVECRRSADALSNVVLVTARLGNLGTVRCSGVAVTRTLVVTSLGCVTVPASLVAIYGSPGAIDVEPMAGIYEADATGDGDCIGGVAAEDGSFATQFGPSIEAERIEVYLASERVNQPGHEVVDVLRVPTSRCADGIALLRLASSVGLSPIPVRASDAREGDEPAVLSAVIVQPDFSLTKRDVDLELPPPSGSGADARAFEMPGTCPDQSGAGLFSIASGALLGVLGSSLGSADCSTPGAGTGVRLAPFRRMLIEAAAPEALQVESGSLPSLDCDGL
jgi:hypothetical protein